MRSTTRSFTEGQQIVFVNHAGKPNWIAGTLVKCVSERSNMVNVGGRDAKTGEDT